MRLSPDPFHQFETWFHEAMTAPIELPEAMALATATRDGRPSARMVLLKAVEDGGFVFFTSYESRKAQELAENPRAALLFHWPPLGRQVRIEGVVRPTSSEASDGYWRTRPLESRISAAVSPQSAVIVDRRELIEAAERLRAATRGDDVPRPATWGGYLLVPDTFEFWIRRENRLHERYRYVREGEGWRIEQLAP